MNQKDYLVRATNDKDYNIRLCEILATGSETEAYDKIYIIYRTPEGEYLKRVKHFHPLAGAPEVTYEIISSKEFAHYEQQKLI
ncbi:hypothetical protein [Adhaeribacter rhizoryzae]|uniref:Uncharacterized protein n=1 Tax=Adhaeribacter rhizoryzae TaxID=2607907 RepID=A0A5M6D9B0_9BACT|nr:hypothetical protein [Adhaeribacter rhizoryzae]KAA5542509.1 hypothetical protein F0145_18845 [Adhaeribacter rhizoryzae]